AAFDPSDPIFFAAVMRETVRPGAHVVYEFDGPGAAVGPIPVTVEPPFDCLGSKSPIGPLAPGTYVIRYRYGDSPGSADLASGSFTVVDRPGGAAAASPSPIALASAGAASSSLPAASSTSWHVAATIPVGVKPFNIAAGA